MNATNHAAIELLKEIILTGRKSLFPLLDDLLTDLKIEKPTVHKTDTILERCYQYHHLMVMEKMVDPKDSPVWDLAKRFQTDLEKLVARQAHQRMCLGNDRGTRLPRKERAARLRSYFAVHGIRCVQVVTPNYSMAMVVDVKVPGYPRCYYMDNHEDYNMSNAYQTTYKNLNDLVISLFPGTEDRSYYMSDYFQSYWSIHQWV